MGNSAAPMPVRANYHDFSVKIVNSGKETDRYYGAYYYDFEITNTGEEYAAIDYFRSFEEINNWQNVQYIYFDEDYQIFMNPALAPGQTGTFRAHMDRAYELKDDLVFESEYYMYPIKDIEFNNPKILKYKEKNTYVFKADIKHFEDINYALFIDVTYQGQPRSFYVYFNRSDRTFRTYQELDLNQLEITGVRAYKERASSRGYQLSTSQIVAMTVVFTLLLSAILVPVIIVTETKKRRK